MRVNLDRLSERMGATGYCLSYFDASTLEIVFVKPFSDEIFSRVQVTQGWERSGTAGDIVSAGVECSIVPGRTFLKGMGTRRCLIEVAGDPIRGSTKIANDAEALAWEEMLSKIGPQQADLLCAEHSSVLISSTAAIRRIAQWCLDACRKYKSGPKSLLAAMEAQAQEWQFSEYRRILNSPIQVIPDGRIYYQIAVLSIVLYSGEAKGDRRWFESKNPDSADRELMILIQFMSSILAGESGWSASFFANLPPD
jgi:hypothetical protein